MFHNIFWMFLVQNMVTKKTQKSLGLPAPSPYLGLSPKNSIFFGFPNTTFPLITCFK